MNIFKIILTFILISPIYAKTHYLIVDGGIGPGYNSRNFYNEVRRGYETIKNNGNEVAVLAKDGRWRVSQNDDEPYSKFALTPEGKKSDPNKIKRGFTNYPPIAGKATSTADIKNAIDNFDLKKGDQVVLYMTGHGSAPEELFEPSTAGYEFWGDNYETWESIAKELKGLTEDVSLKVVSNNCYDGGIHHLARTLPNTCTSSVVPYFTSNSMGYLFEHPFAVSFWSNVNRESGKTTLAQAAIAGFKGDIANRNLGSLSSFDYVDYVLNAGQYDGKLRKEIVISIDPDKKDELGDTLVYLSPPSDFISVLPPSSLINSPHNALFQKRNAPGNICIVSSLDQVAMIIVELEILLDDLTGKIYESSANSQNKRLRTVFHDVIDDMRENGVKYLKIAKEYDVKFRDLKRRWDRKKTKAGKRWDKDGSMNARFQKEYDYLKIDAEFALAKFSFDHQMLDRLQKLEEFNRVATPEQKKKFVQLLQCEWEPLS